MTSSTFAQLKNNNNVDKLTAELNKIVAGKQQNQNDDKFWSITKDKAGNGSAVIRFLPAPMNEDMPFVRVWSHSIQGPGGWYIENSLTTLGQDDPVSELNTALFNSGIESNKEIARKQKRKLQFISNIYIIEDKAKPENEGKVFLFKYGKKLFEKINDLLHPQFDDEEKINAFDFWNGANFKMRVRMYEGYVNYDKSEFASSSALFKDDETLQKIWENQHSLQQFLAPSNFKSYDDLKTKLAKVLGQNNQKAELPKQEAVKQKEISPPWEEASKEMKSSDDDDDEGLSYFAKLAQSS